MIPVHQPIAVAEDNDDDVFFLRRAMKTAEISHPLIVLPSGRDVIDYFAGEREFADRSAYPLSPLMLLDLKLPIMSGFKVLEWLQVHGEGARPVIVVMTTSGEEKDRERAYALGASSFLVKPSGAEALAKQMRAFKTFWLEQNAFPRM